MKGITVIIPTLNRTEFLINTLKDLVKQECDFPFEIVVVDQSRVKDKVVVEFAKEYNLINYHYITTFRGLPEARNYGSSIAKYNYLLYLDDDISCNVNLLSEHYRALLPSDIGMVAGGITEKNNPNVGEKVGHFVKWSATPLTGFHLKGERIVSHVKGCNFSIKKDDYLKNIGIDQALTKGAALYEELDLCLRLSRTGQKIKFQSSAHVFHHAAQTGGCRVPNILDYVKSLSRNRSIIIGRYLPWYFKISAHIYLLRLVFSYMLNYKNIGVLKSYCIGVIEGKKVAKLKPINSFT